MTLKRRSNFNKPQVLSDDTPFLGATVGTWNLALTRGMQEALVEEKKLQQMSEQTPRSTSFKPR